MASNQDLHCLGFIWPLSRHQSIDYVPDRSYAKLLSSSGQQLSSPSMISTLVPFVPVLFGKQTHGTSARLDWQFVQTQFGYIHLCMLKWAKVSQSGLNGNEPLLKVKAGMRFAI